MSVKYVVGDIVALAETGKYDAVIHGCNCFNTMGSGVAKALRDKWPQVYAVDNETTKGDIRKLGGFTVASAGCTLVVNAYTQYSYNPRVHPFEYSALSAFFTNFTKYYDDTAQGKLLMPKIGAGLGGGDWNVIEQILINTGLDITVCVLEEE